MSFDTDQLDRTGWPAQREALTRAFATRTRDEWCDHFSGTNACVSPVLGLDEAPHHPHLQARRTFTAKRDGYEPVAAPRFSRTPGHEPAGVAASAGTAAFLRAAGFTDDQVASLFSNHA